MPTIQLDGRAVHYLDSRPSGGDPALVLIHGAGGSGRVWPAALTGLPGRHVLTLDLPGHGLSRPPGRRSVSHYAAAVEAFIVALSLESPVLIGHSMGSAIALAVAHRGNVLVRGLALLGAGARMPVGETLLAGSITSLATAAAYIVEQGFAQASQEVRDAVRDEILAAGTTTTFGDFLACNRFDFRPRLATIMTPTLIIAGELDQLMPPRFARKLADGLPHARLLVLEDAGHFAMLDRPQAVAESITQHIITQQTTLCS